MTAPPIATDKLETTLEQHSSDTSDDIAITIQPSTATVATDGKDLLFACRVSRRVLFFVAFVVLAVLGVMLYFWCYACQFRKM